MQLAIEVSGCNDGTDDEADIYLGQIPLVGFQDSNYVHPMAHSLPQTLEPNAQSSELPSNTPYSESMTVRNVTQNENVPYSKQIGFVINPGSKLNTVRYPGYPYPDDPSSYKPFLEGQAQPREIDNYVSIPPYLNS